MFTGLIEQQSVVISNIANGLSRRLAIQSPFAEMAIGESIAVNGVCLTVLPSDEENLVFDISPETCLITTLSNLSSGDGVNLERAMLASARFGGHYVSGHVDATARVQSVSCVGDFVELLIGGFSIPPYDFLLPKGSITLDGVSLTINAVNNNEIKLMLVPHTLSQTTLGQLTQGQRVNVEFDYFTRIVAHQLTIAGYLKGGIEL